MEEQVISQMIESLKLNEVIDPQSIPHLDLYMDQVITLFEEKLSHTKRYEQDKLLTKTMINNYTKDRLLMPAKKKKYTREHIILMILLYEMKQILCISDIKALFATLIKEEKIDGEKLAQVYDTYLEIKKLGLEDFKEQVCAINQGLEEEIQKLVCVEEEERNSIGDMLMVIMLTQKANYYKRLAEKIIDEKVNKKTENKKDKDKNKGIDTDNDKGSDMDRDKEQEE